MKLRQSILVGLLLLAQSAAAQETAVADYFAAFDRARATLRQAGDSAKPQTQALHDRLTGELEAIMRRIVGPLAAPKGFTGSGRWNPELWPGIGSDRLDGISFWNGQLGQSWAYLVVTTDEVLREWIARQIAGDPELQTDLDGGFQSGKLSAQIVTFDGWMSDFAFLPIDRPSTVDAVTAFVGTGGNGELAWPPTLLSIYVRKGHRIYLADIALTTKFSAIAACDALRTADLAAYNECWEERGKGDPAFAAAIKQAQGFIDGVAGP